MAKIQVTVNTAVTDGMLITFKAPCDCTAVEGLLINGSTYSFRDTHGNDLTGLGNLFSQGACVRAVLDTRKGYAYLQNADTNGYIEQYKQSKLEWMTDEDVAAMFSGSYEGTEDEDNTLVAAEGVAF